MDAAARKAKRMTDLPAYLMDEVVRLKDQAVARGMDVIDLGVGDPDFPTPPHILAAAHAALDDAANHHYSSYRGLAALRRAFVDWYRDRFGVVLDPDTEVLPLIGSKEGIGHVHLAFVGPGDEVLIPDPGYPTYQGGTILAGGTPRYYSLRAETGWLPPEIALDRRGYVLTGSEVQDAGRWQLDRDPYLLETSVPGIFACGDVRSAPVKRVAAAVGEGSMAIAFVHQYLKDADTPPAG